MILVDIYTIIGLMYMSFLIFLGIVGAYIKKDLKFIVVSILVSIIPYILGIISSW